MTVRFADVEPNGLADLVGRLIDTNLRDHPDRQRLLGSTVVLLFPKMPLQFNPAWAPGGAVRLGEVMAQRG